MLLIYVFIVALWVLHALCWRVSGVKGAKWCQSLSPPPKKRIPKKFPINQFKLTVA